MYSPIASAAGTSNGITKYCYGTLVLAGTNTYCGPTTIEGGTLCLGASQVLPSASPLVLAGGDTRTDDPLGYDGYWSSPTFATGGYNQTLGALSLTGPYTPPHTIDFGHGASALAFADSHTQDWNGMTLYISNFKPGTDSLRFGTNSSGLTAAQLNLIQFSDFLDLPGVIDATGYVTPMPATTVTAVLKGSTGVTLSWGAISNRSYNIQFKVQLSDVWNSNSIRDVVAASANATFTDLIGTNAHRYYRIMLRPISNGI
jgi:autotransporter-associated beta strand protein